MHPSAGSERALVKVTKNDTNDSTTEKGQSSDHILYTRKRMCELTKRNGIAESEDATLVFKCVAVSTKEKSVDSYTINCVGSCQIRIPTNDTVLIQTLDQQQTQTTSTPSTGLYRPVRTYVCPRATQSNVSMWSPMYQKDALPTHIFDPKLTTILDILLRNVPNIHDMLRNVEVPLQLARSVLAFWLRSKHLYFILTHISPQFLHSIRQTRGRVKSWAGKRHIVSFPCLDCAGPVLRLKDRLSGTTICLACRRENGSTEIGTDPVPRSYANDCTAIPEHHLPLLMKWKRALNFLVTVLLFLPPGIDRVCDMSMELVLAGEFEQCPFCGISGWKLETTDREKKFKQCPYCYNVIRFPRPQEGPDFCNIEPFTFNSSASC